MGEGRGQRNVLKDRKESYKHAAANDLNANDETI